MKTEQYQCRAPGTDHYINMPESWVSNLRAQNFEVRDLVVKSQQEDKDETYMLKREIHNLKRHIEDYCPGLQEQQSNVLTDEQLKTIRFAAEALEGLGYEDTAGELRDILIASGSSQ